MLGFYYALLLVGWLILIIILKWRKGRAKREAELQQQQNARPQIHVIQIGSSLYDVIPISPNHQNFRCDCPEYNHLTTDSNLNHHTNIGFILEEGAVFPPNHIDNHRHRGNTSNNNSTSNDNNSLEVIYDNSPSTTPPPSYDEVMKQYQDRNDENINRTTVRNDRSQRNYPKPDSQSGTTDRNANIIPAPLNAPSFD